MKILTAGGAMIDTIAVIANEQIERMSMRNADKSFLLLEEGRKTDAEAISTHCGGGAVNAAVAMARLGHDVSAMVKLGQDTRAEKILTQLAEEGISTRYALRDPRAPTGASEIVAAHDRDAAIFTFRGANALLEIDDLNPDAFGTDLVYISSLSNKSVDCFPVIAQRAKEKNARVATNPGIRQLTGCQDAFRGTLPNIDILALNRHEAATLVPWLATRSGEGGAGLHFDSDEAAPELAHRGFAFGGFQISLPRYMESLIDAGPEWIVITNGRDGTYVGSKSGIYHCPVVKADIAGTAGAGDAFNATFASSIADGEELENALLLASINAASVVSFIDTQTGLLSRDELKRRCAKLESKTMITHWPN